MRVKPVLQANFTICFPNWQILDAFVISHSSALGWSVTVPSAAMSAAVMAAAAASVRVGGIQVQEIHLDDVLLGVHLIHQFQHGSSSFKFTSL